MTWLGSGFQAGTRPPKKTAPAFSASAWRRPDVKNHFSAGVIGVAASRSEQIHDAPRNRRRGSDPVHRPRRQRRQPVHQQR